MRCRSSLFALTLLAMFSSPLIAGFAGVDLFLPAAGRIAGAGGSQFYTTVWITNPGSESQDVQISFMPAGRLTPIVATERILPGETREVENITESLFHAPGTLGGLRFRASDAILVTSRIYNQADGTTPADSHGSVLSAVPGSFGIVRGEVATLQGVAQNADYRYNFMMMEVGGHAAKVVMELVDSAGNVASVKSYELAGFEQLLVSVSDLAGTAILSNSRLRTIVLEGDGRVIVAGSLVSNRSHDTTAFEMSYKSTLLAGNATPGVTTLNGLTGDVVLEGTNGVSITRGDGTLTVSASGVVGPQGPQGASGAAGATGAAGRSGYNALVETSVEPAGIPCETGGLRLIAGLDSDRNGQLDPTEANPSLTRLICNGATGAAGPQGATGPQGVEGEVGAQGSTGAMGPTGPGGATGPVGQTGPEGQTGPVGPTGLQGPIGPQGALGPDGFNSVVRSTAEPAGANCVTGGVKYEAGLDLNRNGTLDTAEIDPTVTRYLCNGAQGPQGPQGNPGATGGTGATGVAGPAGSAGVAGLKSLIKTTVEAAGANCATGGVKVEVGIDTNGNGTLEAGEVTSAMTRYVCSGAPGLTFAQTISAMYSPYLTGLENTLYDQSITVAEGERIFVTGRVDVGTAFGADASVYWYIDGVISGVANGVSHQDLDYAPASFSVPIHLMSGPLSAGAHTVTLKGWLSRADGGKWYSRSISVLKLR